MISDPCWHKVCREDEWHPLQASLRKEREEKGSLKSEIARLQQQLTRQAEILIRQGQEITALQKVAGYEIHRCMCQKTSSALADWSLPASRSSP